MTLVFEVQLPPRNVSSNARVHWRERSRAVKEYREHVAWAVVAATVIPDTLPDRVRVSLLFGIKGGRRAGLYQPRDEPNAVDAAKPLFDGLKDARVIRDDSKRHMELGKVEIASKQGPWVRVTIEELIR